MYKNLIDLKITLFIGVGTYPNIDENVFFFLILGIQGVCIQLFCRNPEYQPNLV